jgi:small-conductance mechanosensitive channel
MECGQWVNGDLYNGRIVRIANSFVFKEPVFNYSGDFPFVWDELMLPIKFWSNHVLARQMLQQVAEEIVGDYADGAEAAWTGVVTKFMIEHARVKPAVTLTANQNWIELTLRYVVDYKQRRATKDLLFTRILQEIDKSEGQIGIAASTLNIEKLAPLEIRVADEVRVRGFEAESN